ncbi:type II toxin-antitoxin system HicA family toxin [Breznakiellaceae bacterium SP9]
MKHMVLLKRIADSGAVFLRYGSDHDIYYNPKTTAKQPIPRHPDIEDLLPTH